MTASHARAERSLAERLLALLDEGSTSTTYKYALLLAIIEACQAGTDARGRAPSRIEVDELADHVLEQYWGHTDPYDGRILRQSGTGEAEILTLVQRFRTRAPGARSTISVARPDPAYVKLRSEVAWKLAEMPIPRLQRIGKAVDPFLYELTWGEAITRSAWNAATFDRSITLRPGAGDELVRLAPLVRPLVERLWAARVTRYNRLPDGRLEEFLFRRARLDAVRLRVALLELQDGRCFYTGALIKRAGDADVDHVVPWSRSPNNAVENLVVASRTANNDKRDHLLASTHLATWRARNARHADDLRSIADANRWDSNPAATLGIARSLYLRLGSGVPLWLAPGQFVPSSPDEIAASLSA